MTVFLNAATVLILVWLMRRIWLRLSAGSTFCLSRVPARPASLGSYACTVLLVMALPAVSRVMAMESSSVGSLRIAVVLGFLFVWLLENTLDFREYGVFYRQSSLPWDQVRSVQITAQRKEHSLLCIRPQWGLPIRVWIPSDRQAATVQMIRGAARFERQSLGRITIRYLAAAGLWGGLGWGLFAILQT